MPAPLRFDKAILVKLESSQHATLHTLAALDGVDMSTWIRARIDEAAKALAARDDERRATRAARRAAKQAGQEAKRSPRGAGTPGGATEVVRELR